MVRREIVVTDLTRMKGSDVCLAGIVDDGSDSCVRPLWQDPERPDRELNPNEHWLRGVEGGPVAPLCRLELDFLHHRPQPPHIEDWITGREARVIEPAISDEERRGLLLRTERPNLEELFGAPITWNSANDTYRSGGWLPRGTGRPSLGTLRAIIQDVIYFPKYSGDGFDYKLKFRDQSGQSYRLSVSDLSFRYVLDWHRLGQHAPSHIAANEVLQSLRRARKTWLRIGLTRAWAPRDTPAREGCYLQITAVHTIPDYLEG